MINDLGLALKSLAIRWTKSAAECYRNGLMCAKCTIADDLKAQCKMKPVVLELVRKYGKPKKEADNEEDL